MTGKPEYFDAFVCSSPADVLFVKQLISMLEDEYHRKLCVPDRDLAVGGFKLEDKIKMINDR